MFNLWITQQRMLPIDLILNWWVPTGLLLTCELLASRTICELVSSRWLRTFVFSNLTCELMASRTICELTSSRFWELMSSLCVNLLFHCLLELVSSIGDLMGTYVFPFLRTYFFSVLRTYVFSNLCELVSSQLCYRTWLTTLYLQTSIFVLTNVTD